jgi:hypothetical protein
MITDMALPLIPILIGLVSALYVVARKSWKNEQTLRDVHKEVCGDREHPELGLVAQMAAVRLQVNTLRTQFEPFLKVLDDSLARMMTGGVKGNPIDVAMLRKIKFGHATLEEIEKLDAEIAQEIQEKGPDSLYLVMARYWLDLKKTEARKAIRE